MLKLVRGGTLHLTVHSPTIARFIMRHLPLESLWKSGYLYTIHTAESVGYSTVRLRVKLWRSTAYVILILNSELTPAQKSYFGLTNSATSLSAW